MTDTAPQSNEPVANTVVPHAADAHKGPENAQSATHDTSTKALPLTDADNPPKTTNDVETTPSTSSKPAPEGKPQHSSIYNVPSDSATPLGENPPSESNPGETSCPSSNTVSDGEKPGQGDNALAEQPGMEVDTPTPPNKPLTDGAGNGDHQIHPPSIPLSLSETREINLDLLPRIPRLFRLLDLVSDKHIEKIIIDHDSMGAAMNTLRDGAYKTISKINFAALDGASINPVGLYGSKSALTQTLMTLDVVDESLGEQLRQPINRSGQLSPYLRSGIYLFLPPISASDVQASSSAVIYVIYWPEDETWNDDAPPNVQKNRVTFMRYLTKLAQDIRPLVSEEHAAAFVWKYDDDKARGAATSDSSTDDESDDDDRFVKFEVKESGQQDEGVQQYPGFTFVHPFLGYYDPQSAIALPILGETSQAFMLSHTHKEGTQEKKFNGSTNGTWLRTEMTKDHNVYLGEGINEEVIKTLFDLGAMRSGASHIYLSYKNRKKELEPKFLDKKDAALSQLKSEWPQLQKHAESLVRRRFSEVYSTLHILDTHQTSESKDSLEYLTRLSTGVPKARTALDNYREQEVPAIIDSQEYKNLKKKFIDVAETLYNSVSITEEEAQTHIDSIASSRARSRRTNSEGSGYFAKAVTAMTSAASVATSSVTSMFGSSRPGPERPKFSRSSFGRDDVGFLRALEQYNSQDRYKDAVQVIKNAATHWIETRVWETAEDFARTIQLALESSATEEAFKCYCEEEFSILMGDLRQALIPHPAKPFGIKLEFLQPVGSSSHNPKFVAKGSTFTFSPPFVEHSMTQLQARREETDLLEHEPSRIPSLSPHRSAVTRSTPLGWRVLHVQLIDQGRRILHIIESSIGVDIFLSDARDTEFRKSRKHFPSREGRSLFFAADEQTCQLVVVYLDQQRSFLQAFSMEEHFEALQPRGPRYELTHLYDEGPPDIQDICFFSGSDGICLLEKLPKKPGNKAGKIRVFSSQTQAFWPGSIELSSLPVMMRAAPDGSALLLVERIQDETGWQLRLYHQATFGENQDGKTLLLPPEFNDAIDQSFTVSSLGQRKHIYLLAHTPSKSRIISIALRISRSESHWSFRRKQLRSLEAQGVTTKHNSVVDCFAAVWERFPVVPAISRDFTASRPPLSLTFVTYSERNDLGRIPHYFAAMAQDFTRQSHKPTGRHLSDINVRMLSTGEWFVELISLIPIHIAVARDNRFLPYKDGISGEAIQQELLGTEVADIIDIITLGPYEAILGSYMATRPLKVVSSMGEQSVGKSYSLNHLVDTSFAGSAMRTTEGVWLSLCPTKDQVVIALDFEGVQSLERTAQEDMLLVLFNAAISNLIMFRNNFALNRNVANMFTSFQASARLFDPGNNPNLFKGLLTIIIKDVMDADKREIVEEFGSKFSQIVNEEQGGNFITVLHANQLAVMPWDVIRSKEFYTRFSKLSKYLFKQQSTHTNAGEFLLTLKTLMAKITAQDWGAIDQTLIRHRTSILQASLEQALISGQGDVGPFGELEGLKNYDTQQVLDGNDTDAIFYLGTDEDSRQEGLINLLARLGSEPARSDVDNVKSSLQDIGMKRIAHSFLPIFNSVVPVAIPASFAVCARKLMLLASMTAGPRIDASTRVLSAHLKNVGIRERVGCRLDMMAPIYVRLQLTFVENLAPSMTSEAAKRLASSRPSMRVNICAEQTSINVASLADFVALSFTMDNRFHVPMSARSRSTNSMNLIAAEKSARAQFDANSVHGIALWVTTFMGLNLELLICATIPGLHKTRGGWGAASESLQDTERIKGCMLIPSIRAFPTSAKQLAPSVDTSVTYPTVTRKGSTIPLTGPCKKLSGPLKSQGIRQLRPKVIGLEPKRAVLRNCVSCIANILAGMHTSISVEMILHTAKKQNLSMHVSESFRTLASQKIGYRIDCSGLGLVSKANASDLAQYVSGDGHHFNCPDPTTLIPVFHVIFVLDR
ncbi:hypothetical protein FRC00_014366 [Tulasnella sp. 408]|nr:hypothetical protein FRC00_014366 [Tulasnella sp. 408]